MIQVIFFLGFIGLIDWYAFQSFKTLSLDWGHNFSKQLLINGYWAISILLPVLMMIGMYMYFTTNTNPSIGRWSFALFLSIFICKLIIILFLLGEDALRVAQAGKYYLTKNSGEQIEQAFLPGRRKFVSQIALGVAALPFLSFIYGITKGKYHYKVHKIQLFFKDLPEAFHGFTISQISDVHSGSYDSLEGVEKGIELINEQKSDLFVFTGDLVNSIASEFNPWVDSFKKISAPFGKFSILGNHDYGDYRQWESDQAKQNNFNNLLEQHEKVGFKLLRNESMSIEKDGEKISLAGVENWGRKFHQYGDLDKAIQGIEATDFTILLSHDPTHFDAKVKNHDKKIHLTLSGHTHGMQMGVEFPWLKWSPIKYIYPKWAGLYTENDRFLYVNRGFGFLGFAGRVGIWPEVTVLELLRTA